MYEKEFIDITKKIMDNRKFKKLQTMPHHYATDRYTHNVNVAYKTYKITKFLNWNYINITKAALMHDFYFNDDFSNHRQGVINHPKISVQNAKKITKIDTVQENIIASHMFPLGKTLPKYKESIIVDLVDDFISIKEIGLYNLRYLNCSLVFIMNLIINYFE